VTLACPVIIRQLIATVCRMCTARTLPVNLLFPAYRAVNGGVGAGPGTKPLVRGPAFRLLLEKRNMLPILRVLSCAFIK
jgi:hypothetical protein